MVMRIFYLKELQSFFFFESDNLLLRCGHELVIAMDIDEVESVYTFIRYEDKFVNYLEFMLQTCSNSEYWYNVFNQLSILFSWEQDHRFEYIVKAVNKMAAIILKNANSKEDDFILAYDYLRPNLDNASKISPKTQRESLHGIA
jgi:hypothetical protein